MSRYIDVDSLKRELKRNAMMTLVEREETVDVVPVKSIEQLKWERDTAIQQLEEHGIPFCGKAEDVVRVVRCKDCKKRGTVYCDLDYCGYRQADNWYCADGERLEEDEID